MNAIEKVADAVFAALPDGGVVVHTQTKRYYSLNHTGARIWALLEERGNTEATVTVLAAEYGISVEEAATAVDRLAADLVAAGLMRRS